MAPPEMQIVSVRSGPARGLRLLADLRSEKFYLTGTYEIQLQETLIELLRPGAVFWDIGGHAGFFGALAARLVGGDGAVHAFEPHPENRRRIDAAVDLNCLKNVSVHGCAIGGYSGKASLYAHGSTSMWTLVPDSEGDEPTLIVDVRTMDELAAQFGIPHVIKLDVEGAEVDALRGGSALLQATRPAMLVEFHSRTLLAEGRSLLSEYRFDHVGGDHWLVT